MTENNNSYRPSLPDISSVLSTCTSIQIRRLKFAAQGDTREKIARREGIGLSTVKNMFTDLYDYLGTKSELRIFQEMFAANILTIENIIPDEFDASKLRKLTPKTELVLQAMIESGTTAKTDLAANLGYSPDTIKMHQQRIIESVQDALGPLSHVSTPRAVLIYYILSMYPDLLNRRGEIYPILPQNKDLTRSLELLANNPNAIGILRVHISSDPKAPARRVTLSTELLAVGKDIDHLRNLMERKFSRQGTHLLDTLSSPTNDEIFPRRRPFVDGDDNYRYMLVQKYDPNPHVLDALNHLINREGQRVDYPRSLVLSDRRVTI